MSRPRLFPLFLLLSACPANDRVAPREQAVEPAYPGHAALAERTGPGRVWFRGASLEPAAPLEAGREVKLRLEFSAERTPAERYAVFVHVEGAYGRLLSLDFEPEPPTDAWTPDRPIVVERSFKVPDNGGSRLSFLVGLFRDKERLTVEGQPGSSDGRNRIRAFNVEVKGASNIEELPEIVIPRASKPISADGTLGEPDWQRAPVMTFSDSLGRTAEPRFATKLRLLYDSQNLYVGFEAVDPDVSCPYTKRDDPIYEAEAVELFLMPSRVAPETGPYIELQASPAGIIFDAAFTGPRQGMDTRFDAQQKVGTRIDGTLNQDSDRDRGWVSEWVVPFAALRGVEHPPKAGDEWRMNAFRIDKSRENGKERGEFTAWSPPRVGDFHHVARFGRLKFGE